MIKYPCLTCKATGILTQKATERVTIPPGIETGQTLTFHEKVQNS